MNIKEFMIDVLSQLSEVKENKYKKNYSVEELEFELSLVVSADKKGNVGGKGNFLGLVEIAAGGSVNKQIENTQRVKIKLKPNNVQLKP